MRYKWARQVWCMTLAVLYLAGQGIGAGAAKTTTLLPDGLLLWPVDGVVKPAAQKGQWTFALDANIKIGRIVIKKGTQISLLPTAALEALLNQAQDRLTYDYRLRVRVAQYRGKNYLYTTDFLPLSKKVDTEDFSDANNISGKDTGDTHSDSNRPPQDPLNIPPEVNQQLKSHRAVQTQTHHEPIKKNPSKFILDRLGYFKAQDNQALFVMSGFGQARAQEVFYILPSAMRESMEQIQAVEANRLWFRIVGVVSPFQGRSYLFLHRIVRVYSYGNFR